MNLHDAMRSDTAHVFLNTDEFAEGIILQPEPGDEVIINGRAWLVNVAAPQEGLLNLKLYRNEG